MEHTFKTILKALILTLTYVIEVILISGILIALGLHFPEVKVNQEISFIQLIITGLIGSTFVAWLVTKYKLRHLSAFLIITFILFFSNISVALEGSLFTPDYVTPAILLSLFVQQISISIAFSLTAVLLFRKNLSTAKESVGLIINKVVIAKILLSSVVYMVLYYFWGWLNYNLFTKSFYESGISGLHVPDSSILIKIILFRGILITLSVVPFLLFARPYNKFKIFETASVLFIFGGIIPMIYTVGMLPLELIRYSLIEILLQNFITGMIIYKIFAFVKS